MDRAAERAQAIAEAVADIRAIEAEQGVTRGALERMKARLMQLAARRELFTPADFPAPPADDSRNSTSIGFRKTTTTASRSTPIRPGRRAFAAHNHGLGGDRGRGRRRAQPLLQTRDRRRGGTGNAVVRQSTGVCFLPDELHSIHIEGPH